MDLNNPRGFTDELQKATLAEPSVARNELSARRRWAGGGLGGWGDRLAVAIGVSILVGFVGWVAWLWYAS
jgi:hypothetical protein